MRRWIVLLAAMVIAMVTAPAQAVSRPAGLVYAQDLYTGGYGSIAVRPDGSGFSSTCRGDPTVSASPRLFVHEAADGASLAWSDASCVDHPLYTPEAPKSAGFARWAPGGTRVLFDLAWWVTQEDGTKVQSGETRIGDVVADGAGGLTLADVRTVFAPEKIGFFTWSPDGHTVAFTRTDTAGGRSDSDVWLGDVDSGVLTPLLVSADNDTYPSFSPDGAKVAFTRTLTVNGVPRADVFTVPRSGGAAVQVTRKGNATTSVNRQPSWSPDGGFLAFGGVSNSISSTVHVYRIDAAGATKAVDLTPKTAASFSVFGWRP